MDKIVGQKVTLTARVGVTDNVLDKICMMNVRKAGEVYSDHEWVVWDKNRLRNLKRGDYIKFTGIITEYIGMAEDGERILKKGLRDLRSIERL
tara:strand:+ start:2698 stop:2976 length:279 start_codon:yes stop_codon:yes gene_type:complete